MEGKLGVLLTQTAQIQHCLSSAEGLCLWARQPTAAPPAVSEPSNGPSIEARQLCQIVGSEELERRPDHCGPDFKVKPDLNSYFVL